MANLAVDFVRVLGFYLLVVVLYILLTLHFSQKSAAASWCEVYRSTPPATDSTVVVLSSYSSLFLPKKEQSNTYDEKMHIVLGGAITLP